MNNASKDSAYMWVLFSLAVIYFALLSASVYEDGMTVFELFRLSADASLKDIRWTSYTLHFVFIFLLLYTSEENLLDYLSIQVSPFSVYRR